MRASFTRRHSKGTERWREWPVGSLGGSPLSVARSVKEVRVDHGVVGARLRRSRSSVSPSNMAPMLRIAVVSNSPLEERGDQEHVEPLEREPRRPAPHAHGARRGAERAGGPARGGRDRNGARGGHAAAASCGVARPTPAPSQVAGVLVLLSLIRLHPHACRLSDGLCPRQPSTGRVLPRAWLRTLRLPSCLVGRCDRVRRSIGANEATRSHGAHHRVHRGL